VDTITYDVYLRALWAVPSILEIIDMDEMVREARRRGGDANLDLILALRSLKEERHVHDPQSYTDPGRAA
jgi:hypothetical protein